MLVCGSSADLQHRELFVVGWWGEVEMLRQVPRGTHAWCMAMLAYYHVQSLRDAAGRRPRPLPFRTRQLRASAARMPKGIYPKLCVQASKGKFPVRPPTR